MQSVFPHTYAEIQQDRPKEQLLQELREAIDIRRASRQCAEDHDSEAAWNDEVHSRVLRLALRPCSEVGYKNITTARIQPARLVPRHVSGNVLESKMVDYAIYLAPDEEMRVVIRDTLRLLQPKESQSINQTMYDSLRQRPIAISIETKTPNAPEEQVGVQLGVWVAAHFTRLHGLVTTYRCRRCPCSLLPAMTGMSSLLRVGPRGFL
ncbi:hypothetical protein H2201_009118 [Coniosporium apollinis]|uniref:PD-(D/E)XK nuclease-like domain-containing protein n=2 Tax=Coniosporium TaxID=2810619 RepID=A0ABQ9NEN1_9PEZI|nr:hypothetical protein H2199_009118 [Cladosporium sp. JES 115]KAJ9653654.1 hypothetical protein H2201_009118 [Coniosporium apollinis]